MGLIAAYCHGLTAYLGLALAVTATARRCGITWRRGTRFPGYHGLYVWSTISIGETVDTIYVIKKKLFFFLCCGLWFLLTQLVHEQEQVCLWLNTWARHTTSDRNWLSLYSSSRFPCRDDLLWNRSVLLQQVDDRVQIRNCQTKWMPCRCFASPRNRRGFTLKIWSRWSEKV